MPKQNTFKSKVPQKLWQTIFEWNALGMSVEGILKKLQVEYKLKYNPRTIYRLLEHVSVENKKVIDATITNQVKNQVVTDYESLNELTIGLKKMLKTAENVDNNLYLRVADRLLRVYLTKLGLNSNMGNKEGQSENGLAELLDKFKEL